MAFTVLLTSASEDSEDFLGRAGEVGLEVLHLPLEKYVAVDVEKDELKSKVEEAENLIYGHKRNALFFMERVQEFDLLELVTERVNLAGDPLTAEFLEEHGVPAIYPGSRKPIKMLEFLMRLRRLGTVFYPCGVVKNEELPGLLTELDIEVNEHVFYDLEGPTEEELNSFQQQLNNKEPDAVIYHSRRSVNRIQAAFPDLVTSETLVVAGDKAVANKLWNDHEIEANYTAGGSWESILEQVRELG